MPAAAVVIALTRLAAGPVVLIFRWFKTPHREPLLHPQVADHFNAEIVAGTIGSRQDAIDYLTWTFFYRCASRDVLTQSLSRLQTVFA